MSITVFGLDSAVEEVPFQDTKCPKTQATCVLMREYGSRSVNGIVSASVDLDTGGLKGSCLLVENSGSYRTKTDPESVYEAHPCFLCLFCWCGFLI